MQPEKAIWVFRMPILGGCVLCTGMVRKLFNILIGSVKEHIQSNHITILCLLSACNHPGLVDEDMCCYSMMILGQGRKRGVPYHYIGT
jgi:hypothetical protein